MRTSILCSGVLHRGRSMLGVWQRSLLALFILPLLFVCAWYLADSLDSALFQVLVKADVDQRVEAFGDVLSTVWFALLALFVSVRVTDPRSGRLPWALEMLPVSKLRKTLAWNALPLAGWCAVVVAGAWLSTSQLQAGLGLYGGLAFVARATVLLYLLGAVLAAGAGLALMGRLWARWLPRRATYQRVLALGAAGALAAFALKTSGLPAPWASGVAPLFESLYFRSTVDWTAFAAVGGWTLALGAAALFSTALPAAEAHGPFQPRAALRARPWRLSETPWRRWWQTDLRLIRRERGGLFSALVGQVLFLATAWVCVDSNAFGSEDATIRQAQLESLVLLLPLVWGAQAVLSGGLDAHGGQQLVTAPTRLGERLWGKFLAALTFAGLNWIGCFVVFALLFDLESIQHAFGLGLGYLVMATAASFLAGYLLPPDVSTFRSVQGSTQTWMLATLLVAFAFGAIWFTAQEIDGERARELVQLFGTAVFAVLFLFLTQRDQLRHGLRSRA